MSSHRHRIPGWSDLNPATTTLLCAALFLASVPASPLPQEEVPLQPSPQEEIFLQPRVESPDDSVFLAPFVNLSFLRSMKDLLAELQIIQERSTAIYLDRKSLLIWTRKDNGRDIDWRRARAYCSDLELAGFEDWRLPILGELEAIMNPLSNAGYSTPTEIGLSACCVWSSTRKDEVAAWNFNYRYSKRFSGSKTHTYDLRALCVRHWSEADGWVPGEEEPESIP